jgi:D-arabinose 1-dehydrogenase-like Zn-dependent alcohol dehydrogenase
VPDLVVASVLAALAGTRRGQRVAAVGAGPLTTAALLAASGTAALVDGDADVVVAGAPYDVPAAVDLLAPGGRLVALAADAGAARRVATGAGLQLRHVEALPGRVAWSAIKPVGPPGAAPDARGTLDA